MCPEAAVRVNQPLTAGGRGVQPLAFKTWMGLWDPKMFGACTCQTFNLRRAGGYPRVPANQLKAGERDGHNDSRAACGEHMPSARRQHAIGTQASCGGEPKQPPMTTGGQPNHSLIHVARLLSLRFQPNHT